MVSFVPSYTHSVNVAPAGTAMVWHTPAVPSISGFLVVPLSAACVPECACALETDAAADPHDVQPLENPPLSKPGSTTTLAVARG